MGRLSTFAVEVEVSFSDIHLSAVDVFVFGVCVFSHRTGWVALPLLQDCVFFLGLVFGYPSYPLLVSTRNCNAMQRNGNKQPTQALVHVGRANRSGQLQRSGYQDEVPKTADKMMALVAIATSLAPGAKIDEQVSQSVGRSVCRSSYPGSQKSSSRRCFV